MRLQPVPCLACLPMWVARWRAARWLACQTAWALLAWAPAREFPSVIDHQALAETGWTGSFPGARHLEKARLAVRLAHLQPNEGLSDRQAEHCPAAAVPPETLTVQAKKHRLYVGVTTLSIRAEEGPIPQQGIWPATYRSRCVVSGQARKISGSQQQRSGAYDVLDISSCCDSVL